MSSKPVSLQKIRDAWYSVSDAKDVVRGNLKVASLVGTRMPSQEFRDVCFNLLLIAAFSALEEALKQLRLAGKFKSKSTNLCAMMQGSKSALPWVDFKLIDEGRKHRNKCAHERMFLPHTDCENLVGAIESELQAWGVL